ncbi:MAG: hypothetical protein AAFM92_14390 [Pseudomonadota bacterium]
MAEAQRRHFAEEERGSDHALPKAFSWAELSVPVPTSGVARITVSPESEGYATTPGALPEDARLVSWLASSAADRVTLAGWPGTPFEDLRAALFTIWEALPHAQVVLEDAAASLALERALTIWPDQVVTPQDLRPLPRRVAVAECGGPAPSLRLELEDLDAEHDALLADLDAPESPERVAQRMAHLREASLAKAPRQARYPDDGGAGATLHGHGAAASNALIPGVDRAQEASLHLGRGYMLRLGGAGAEVTLFDRGPRREGGPAVIFDPRPGKVLKHEMVHVLSVAGGKGRAAISALRVLGHGARHLHLVAADPAAAAQVRPGSFIFCDGWTLLGIVTARVGADGTAFAALRTGAIWDDLSVAADLGSAEAAETLSQLNALRFLSTRQERQRAAKSLPELVIPTGLERGR